MICCFLVKLSLVSKSLLIMQMIILHHMVCVSTQVIRVVLSLVRTLYHRTPLGFWMKVNSISLTPLPIWVLLCQMIRNLICIMRKEFVNVKRLFIHCIGMCRNGSSTCVKTRVWNTGLTPVLIYGCQCVNFNATSFQKLEKTQGKLVTLVWIYERSMIFCRHFNLILYVRFLTTLLRLGLFMPTF